MQFCSNYVSLDLVLVANTHIPSQSCLQTVKLEERNMKIQQSTVALTSLLLCVTAVSAWATPFPRDLSVLAALHEPKKFKKRVAVQRLFSTSETVVDATVDQEKAAIDVPSSSAATKLHVPVKVLQLPAGVSIPTIVTVIAATVATFGLNNVLNLGPVTASSIAGLLATLVLPEKLAIAAFCGTFAGMAKTAVIPGVAASGLLGLVCAAMLALFDQKKWLLGVGGRLGFIAQCACTAQFVLASLVLGGGAAGSTSAAAMISSSPLNVGKLAVQLPAVAGLTVLGALVMRYWKHLMTGKSKRLSNTVGSVSVTGLIASLALPASMAGPIFCGSFVAMAAPTKLPTLTSLVWASVLAGAAQQSLAGVLLGGWGGKLGTAALMGVLAYRGLTKVVPETTESALEDSMINVRQ
jgi:hypothetical protein